MGYAGVYDLRNLLEGEIATHRSARDYVRAAVGTDSESLKRASPVFNAERIRVPVFLIHGDEDRIASVSHAESMREALTAQGHPPEWLVEPHEGHGFYDEAARQRMYQRLVRFLQDHTGSAPAAP